MTRKEQLGPSDVGDRLRALPTPAPPEHLAARIKSDIPADFLASTRPLDARRPVPWWWWRPSWLGFGGSVALHAVVIALAVLAGWVLRGRTLPAPESSSLVSAAGQAEPAPTAPDAARGAPGPAGRVARGLRPARTASRRAVVETEYFTDARAFPVSSFDLAVDDASFGEAQRYLERGYLPPASSVFVEDFVNAFDYGDPPPAPGMDVALGAEGAPAPFTADEDLHVVRISLRARDAAPAARTPVNVTLVVDTSASMAAPNRLRLVRAAVAAMLERLTPADRVALIVFDSSARLAVESTPDFAAVARVLDQVRPRGATTVQSALELTYAVARRSRRVGVDDRVILCTDGVSADGMTSDAAMLRRIADSARGGMTLTTVGFGVGPLPDPLMEQLAAAGGGKSAYVESRREARRVLVEALAGGAELIGRDARAEVAFNSDAVQDYRLLGYDAIAAPTSAASGRAPKPADIASGDAISALYEVRLRDSAAPQVGTVSLRYRPPTGVLYDRQTREIGPHDFSRSWETASPALRVASLAARFAQVLRRGDGERRDDLADIHVRTEALAREFPARQDLAEFAALTGAAVSAAPTPRFAADTGAGERPTVILAGAVREPVLVRRVDPVFPDAARVARLTGRVVMRALVDERGEVAEVHVVGPPSPFDRAAVDAVRRWTYKPATLDGRPVKVEITVAVSFESP